MALGRVAQWVQDNKIEISRANIRAEQAKGRWSDDYDSYHTSLNRSNLYTDPEKFFGVMHNSPKLFRKKFIFINDVESSHRIPEAMLMANRIIHQQARQFHDTGLYRGSFQMYMDGALVQSASQLGEVEARSVGTIINRRPYASYLESYALLQAKNGGIMFYAAKQVQKAFPELAVQFNYVQADYNERPHKYTVPEIAIGAATTLARGLTRPGSRHRRRIRSARAKTRRDARLNAKAAARTAAGRRGEYG